MTRLLAYLGVLAMTGPLAWGGEPPLTTDRPDQSDSPYTVPRGLFQIEGGWSYGERDTAVERLTAQVFPAALLRFGVTDAVELRLVVPGITITETSSAAGEAREDGLLDASLGMKLRLATGKGALPDVAFVGTLLIPSGDDGFSSERVDPAFRFAFGNALGERVSLTYNVGMFWLTERNADNVRDTRSFLDWTATVGVAASDRLGAFGELFGVTGVSAGGGPLTAAGGGVTYVLTPRLQVDGRVTIGLSSAALDWTVGVGASHRFPGFRG